MDNNLIKLGLTGNEAKVYMAVLQLGQSDASGIARLAGVKRPTTYLALENLAKQGLVSEITDQKEKIFKAEDPDRLVRLTRKMRRKVIEAETDLEKLLPGLKAIQKKLVEPPKMTFYQGLEGIRTIAEEASGYPQSWYYFGPIKGWIEALSEDTVNELVLDTRQMRVQAGRPTAYLITDEMYKNIKLFRKQDLAIRQAKIFPNMQNTKSSLFIFGRKLAVISLGSVPFGAIIESEEVAELVKMMFLIIWKSLPGETL